MGYATKEQAEAIFTAVKERDEERQARMPDTIAALDQASVARERLRKLGWNDGIYCPKDGNDFALIQWGSTGIHRGHYMGQWPDGHIYCGDFLIHPHGVMFKDIASLSPDEAKALAASDAADVAFMERQVRMFRGDA
jgi:hypothetical protein